MENRHRKVKDTDLFAVEAQFNRSSRMKCATEYYNHVRAIQRAQSHKDTDQSYKAAAHNQAFNLVHDFVK